MAPGESQYPTRPAPFLITGEIHWISALCVSKNHRAHVMTGGPQLVSVAVRAFICAAEQQVGEVQSAGHLKRRKTLTYKGSKLMCSSVSQTKNVVWLKCLHAGGCYALEWLRSVHNRAVLNHHLKLSLLQKIRIVLQHADLLPHPVILLGTCLTLSAVRVIIPMLCE